MGDTKIPRVTSRTKTYHYQPLPSCDCGRRIAAHCHPDWLGGCKRPKADAATAAPAATGEKL